LLFTYSAREKEIKEFDAEDLAVLFKENGVSASFLPSTNLLPEFVARNCQPEDIVLITGAGGHFQSGKNACK